MARASVQVDAELEPISAKMLFQTSVLVICRFGALPLSWGTGPRLRGRQGPVVAAC
jgi:hypothetical protein